MTNGNTHGMALCFRCVFILVYTIDPMKWRWTHHERQNRIKKGNPIFSCSRPFDVHVVVVCTSTAAESTISMVFVPVERLYELQMVNQQTESIKEP